MTKAIGADEFDIPASHSDLALIDQLVQQQKGLEQEIKGIEEKLSEKKKELRTLQENTLPDAMFKVNLKKCTTLSNDEVEIKDDIAITLPKDTEKLDKITNWLEENGHAEVVTAQITLDFARNSHNERAAAIGALVGAGFEPRETTSVNAMTLKSILKKSLASGTKIDLKEFGAFAWRKAVIKRK